MRPIAEINLKNLINNFNYIDSYIGNAKVMAVVKANAYGHGLIEISQTLEKNGVHGLCVAIAEELDLLRSSGITIPILHLGVLDSNNIGLYESKNNICTINSIKDIHRLKEFLNGSSKKMHCHLKFDTGMGRLGIDYKQTEDTINLIKNIKGINLGGIYSHFASSDEKNNKFMDLQLERFNHIVEMADYLMTDHLDYHISNSAGLLKSQSSHCNMVRSGISLYGIDIVGQNHDLNPVMKLKAPLVLTKNISKGDSIGYNRKFIANDDMKVGYIQIGYADGYPLGMMNTETVLFNNHLLKVIGKVSMDITAIDCTDIDINEGDWVTLFGGKLNKIENIYSKTDKNVYSILTGIGERVLREYINE